MQGPSAVESRSARLRLAGSFPLLLSIAIGARSIAVLVKHPAFPGGWGGEMPAVAISIAQGLGYASPFLARTGPTALVPPVYPFLLAGIFKVFGYSAAAGFIALAVNVLLSSLVAIPLFILAQKLFNPFCALVAAWFWALYPLAGYTDALFVWSTSLFTLLLTTYLAVTVSLDASSTRGEWAAYGVLTGVLILTDPVSLVVVAVSVPWLLARRVSGKRLVLALAIACVPPAAWMARNYVVFNQYVFVRSGLGLELSVGVRDDEFLDPRPNSLPNRNPPELLRYKDLGEVRYVRERKEQAMRWIGENPDEYARRTAARVVSFWTGQHAAQRIYLFFGRFELLKIILYSLPALGTVACLVWMFRTRHAAAWLCTAIFALYPVVYYVTHVLPRYRLPLEPLMICLTAGVLFGKRERAANHQFAAR